MIIFAGIDGTGEADSDSYKVTFANSFINKLARKEVVSFDETFYRRGPTIFGTETFALGRMAFDWVVTKWNVGHAKAIFLGGYSRGAAAVIEVAHWLKPLGIPVECLILFDAVDRSTPGYGGGVGEVGSNRAIPDNVKQAIHPMRNIMLTRSRISFQRCGQTQENPSMPHAKSYFFATHGGVGGTPWPSTNHPGGYIYEMPELNLTKVTPMQDSIGATLVSAWTFPKIAAAFANCRARLGVPGNISDGVIPGTPGNTVPGMPGHGPGSGAGKRIHIVKKGDWLSKLAITYYGDMNRWKEIYDANIETIGPDHNLIEVGDELIIP